MRAPPDKRAPTNRDEEAAGAGASKPENLPRNATGEEKQVASLIAPRVREITVQIREHLLAVNTHTTACNRHRLAAGQKLLALRGWVEAGEAGDGTGGGLFS